MTAIPDPEVLPPDETPRRRAAPVTADYLDARINRARNMQADHPGSSFKIHVYSQGSAARTAIARVKGRHPDAVFFTKGAAMNVRFPDLDPATKDSP